MVSLRFDSCYQDVVMPVDVHPEKSILDENTVAPQHGDAVSQADYKFVVLPVLCAEYQSSIASKTVSITSDNQSSDTRYSHASNITISTTTTRPTITLHHPPAPPRRKMPAMQKETSLRKLVLKSEHSTAILRDLSESLPAGPSAAQNNTSNEQSSSSSPSEADTQYTLTSVRINDKKSAGVSTRTRIVTRAMMRKKLQEEQLKEQLAAANHQVRPKLVLKLRPAPTPKKIVLKLQAARSAAPSVSPRRIKLRLSPAHRWVNRLKRFLDLDIERERMRERALEHLDESRYALELYRSTLPPRDGVKESSARRTSMMRVSGFTPKRSGLGTQVPTANDDDEEMEDTE